MTIADEKNNSIGQLLAMLTNKIILKRDVFFIPGITSENCAAWLEPYTKENTSMRQWMEKIVDNWEEKAHFVTFTDEESKKCRSFYNFGEILANKIKPYLRDGCQVDLVGHSMGGLDISAAIINDLIPVSKIRNVITLGSPFHGAEWGQLMKDLSIFSWVAPGAWALIRIALMAKGMSYYQVLQLENMNPKGNTIMTFDSMENRVKLLENVYKLYTFVGTDDDTVKASAFFNGYKIDEQLLKQKLEAVCFEGATHSGIYGLPQDPRVVLNLFKILEN